MFLVVGLQNPGNAYEKTRHNAGAIVLDQLVDSSKWNFSKGANAFCFVTEFSENDVEFLKPETFMNNSGSAVSYVLKKYRLAPSQVIVVHDDIDLPVGEYRVSFGSGSAGHNGVESITNTLGTKDYHRIRIGVSPTDDEGNTRRPVGGEQADFVLKKLSTTDYEKIVSLSENIKKEIEKIVEAKK